jgi:hypothetical protein
MKKSTKTAFRKFNEKYQPIDSNKATQIIKLRDEENHGSLI